MPCRRDTTVGPPADLARLASAPPTQAQIDEVALRMACRSMMAGVQPGPDWTIDGLIQSYRDAARRHLGVV